MPQTGHFLFAVVNPCIDCFFISGHGVVTKFNRNRRGGGCTAQLHFMRHIGDNRARPTGIG